MRLHRFSKSAAALTLIIGSVSSIHVWAGDFRDLVNKPVLLTLIDGRTPQGILSAKTGDESLILRSELPDIIIESRFSWRLVQTINELPHATEQALPRPPQPATMVPVDEDRALDNSFPPAPAPPGMEPGQGFLAPQNPQRIPRAIPVIIPIGPPPAVAFPDLRRTVTSLSINASTSNWNPDAQNDGLMVRIQPLDGFGNVVPVEGYLDVQLATETKLWTGGQSTRSDDRFQISDRWSVPIHAVNFTPSGTIVRLPFRNFRPDRDLDIGPDALVHARLRLHSAGAFDASDEFVLLRAPSRFRDDLQQSQGRRLLPIEGAPRW